MSNVIDIRSRLGGNTQAFDHNEEAAIVDITERRSELQKEDRRQVRRTILTEFIAVHTIVPGAGLMKVALFDINENGVAFDLDYKKGRFQVGEEIAMRVYLNHTTYFPFFVKIKHITDIQDEEVHRHGCEFASNTINDVAFHHFVKFIENVSAALKQDKGDIIVSNLNS
jgi:hypothetical protein